MKYIYDPNRDKVLVLPIEKIKYSSFGNGFIINSINESRYVEESIKALSETDERYKNISDNFKGTVIRLSFLMAIGFANLENESYTELIYPKYTDILRNICYYQALERISLSNSNDISIYEEAKDYKLNHCPKYRKAVTDEEKAFVSTFQEISNQNYLKRIRDEEEINNLINQFRKKLISDSKKSA